MPRRHDCGHTQELGDDGGDDGAEAQDGEGASGQAGGESAADGAAERIAGLSLDGAGGAGGESGAASTSGSGAGAAGGGGEAEAEAVDMDALLESVLLQVRAAESCSCHAAGLHLALPGKLCGRKGLAPGR